MKDGRAHPLKLLQRAGLSDIPAAVVIAVVAVLQYFFLGRLWEGYLLHYAGDVIAENVVLTANILGICGAAALSGMAILRWASRGKANHSLEKDATNKSFDDIRELLADVSLRSTLSATPMLRYTPRNALALEARQDWRGSGAAVVVGLQQRARATTDPNTLKAQLGHEVSHLELGGTGVEVIVRRLVALHFLILSWLFVIFLVGLGFVDRRGLGSVVLYGGFNPVFDATIYVGLSSQFIVLLLSSAVVFTYPYFYVVRREHAHDLRGSQLAQSDALIYHFEARSARRSWSDGWTNFWTLHPPVEARRRVLDRRDVLLVSAVLYPVLVAGLQPLILLLTAGWRTYFGVDPVAWNVGLTAVSGLLLYLALSADFVRLGLSLLLRGSTAIWVIIYAFVAAAATQVPRIVLEFSSGLRNGRAFDEIVERISGGLATGGVNIVVGLGLLLTGLGYLTAAHLAAFGIERPRWAAVWLQVFGGLIVVSAFIVLSLSEFSLQAPVLVSVGAISIVTLIPPLLARCPQCRRSGAPGLWLSTRCKCGHDRLEELRKI